ncbi:fumarylacetoacetate hydrolase [Terasakiispira papahanaumokuakeensis]|uniref:Fumarylacetoacetate hydrolase n=1 Tax=Terasakiispira papahanaumokuakeensis TaxID=197479 RepID=A0A1E2VCM3_9GAMM|nr:fumarylacetoacetate hydrolase family protein [Terasakiispira papahanaumokuakeensis]ODC04576.1 fumarylacetoacetate hydrolase [Terasakiispira papahanaumokuakeensis]
MSLALTPETTLPVDHQNALLVGRAWVPAPVAGPSPIVIKAGRVYDLSQHFATLSQLLETDQPQQRLKEIEGIDLGTVEALLANSGPTPNIDQPFLLAPADLQVIKAAGVTFADSMIERVIEERAGGDTTQAAEIRQQVQAVIGSDLSAIVPGSPQAQALKQLLQSQGLWSQYLEVGIGPDAEIFTKAPVMAAVGSGAVIGIHPKSAWNNPEPEVVLAVNSRGDILGATLGNDVNLRDFEGRSALLLSKAKDNNASCAIGPFIRLFDQHFTLDDVRQCTVELKVEGTDGYTLAGTSLMNKISRDPADLAQQTLNANHQYPDGFLLFLGTLFAPTQDRGEAGSGFTHHPGDRVEISSPQLGRLTNQVTTSDQAPPWTFGLNQLLHNLADRGLLSPKKDQTL